MLKVGDKVRVIEDNLCKEDTYEYQSAKDFIGENKEIFLVIEIWKNEHFPIVISKENGEKLLFSEYELEKVEE